MPPTTTPPPDTLADVLRELGDVPLHRILWNPRPGTATVDDVLRTRHTELVDGMLVRKAVGFEKGLLETAVCGPLFEFTRRDGLGAVTVASGPHRVTRGVVRRPNVAFTRWAKVLNGGRSIPDIVDAAPDLVVEIPTAENTPAELDRKYREHFAAGTACIWEIDPDTRTVAVFTDPTTSTTLTTTDTLDGGVVLPGFTLAVAELFAYLDPPATA